MRHDFASCDRFSKFNCLALSTQKFEKFANKTHVKSRCWRSTRNHSETVASKASVSHLRLRLTRWTTCPVRADSSRLCQPANQPSSMPPGHGEQQRQAEAIVLGDLSVIAWQEPDYARLKPKAEQDEPPKPLAQAEMLAIPKYSAAEQACRPSGINSAACPMAAHAGEGDAQSRRGDALPDAYSTQRRARIVRIACGHSSKLPSARPPRRQQQIQMLLDLYEEKRTKGCEIEAEIETSDPKQNFSACLLVSNNCVRAVGCHALIMAIGE